MMRVCHANVVKSKRVLYHQEVHPAVLLAQVRFLYRHRRPQRTVTQCWKNESCEKNQSGDWWHESEITHGDLFENVHFLSALHSGEVRVRHQQPTQHEKDIGEEVARPKQDRDRSLAKFVHACAVRDGVKIYHHRLVGKHQQNRIDDSNSMQASDLATVGVYRSDLIVVFDDGKRSKPLICEKLKVCKNKSFLLKAPEASKSFSEDVHKAGITFVNL